MSYEVDSSRTVYEGPLSTVRLDRVRMPDGAVAEREVVAHPDAVAVVPVDDDGAVVLVRQYRHAVREWLLELPAGVLDVDGEEPADAARRELAEEVGLRTDSLSELVTFRNSAGWTDETTTVYLARGLAAVPAPDGYRAEGEEADMEIVRLPLDEALRRAQQGEVTDAKTLVGLLLAGSRLRPSQPVEQRRPR